MSALRGGPPSVEPAFRLDGKVALVTGAGSGIGRACALALAAAGADIAALYRRDIDGLGEAIEAAGGRFVPLPTDLADASAADLRAVVRSVVESLGRLDILVNNAGTISRAPALDVTETDWDAVLNLNLRVPFFLAQAAAGHMLANGGGKIINMASLLSFQGGILVAPYTASKSGIAGLTRLLANEWAPHGINVNALAPGYIATNLTEALRADPERSRTIMDRIPAGRWGRPEDLAGALVFLAAPASDYVHGTVLPVDGGWLAR